MMPDAAIMAAHFARTRWWLDFRERDRLERWQQQRLQRFFRQVLPRAQAFRGLRPTALAELPVMDKATMMADFQAYNTRGMALDAVLPIALQAESSRDFSPTYEGLTVGLSSGTSGNRGVFLVSKAERLRWAGILLARTLPPPLLGQLLSAWRAPLNIAFFLRANSNLYTTLNSRRLRFSFHDLLLGVEAAVPRLNATPPDVLVAPPPVLRALAAEAAAGHLHIYPRHIIAVAEVLESRDAEAVRSAFGMIPHQIYQATEGFLAYTCECGSLHLNESFVQVEPEWLDAERTRFQPVITDFTRETQLIVRYRLNDVLRVTEEPCACGRAERSIAAIEGRADEVLWLPAPDGRAVAVFPDFIRRAMLLAGPQVREFAVQQQGMTLHIALLADGDPGQTRQTVAACLADLWRELGVQAPTAHFTDWQALPLGAKRRRVRMLAMPEGLSCTF
ncbi:F390 synthetase-related protein [Candidatus Thiothrix sp. Deng01]|uniref:F390 synthetase-related protein n=1 Tax=Candidatus Thiothrix phosphatis TaxID=3112415 RepID=A0ABU6CRK2_9GAMM|nr:F390 synthetase-related protein [Candidatus Thiothrix sp. Deng01]MEB4589456.1 F390 synthetase-related protein [Candidatus Thiothrix sp. Deng01]